MGFHTGKGFPEATCFENNGMRWQCHLGTDTPMVSCKGERHDLNSLVPTNPVILRVIDRLCQRGLSDDDVADLACVHPEAVAARRAQQNEQCGRKDGVHTHIALKWN